MAGRDGEDCPDVAMLQEDNSFQYYLFMEDSKKEGGMTQ